MFVALYFSARPPGKAGLSYSVDIDFDVGNYIQCRSTEHCWPLIISQDMYALHNRIHRLFVFLTVQPMHFYLGRLKVKAHRTFSVSIAVLFWGII
jgi:hypothetical protein